LKDLATLKFSFALKRICAEVRHCHLKIFITFNFKSTLGRSEGGQTLSYVFSLEELVFWFDRLLRCNRLLRFDQRQRINPNGFRRNSPFRKRQGFLKIFTPILHNTPPTPIEHWNAGLWAGQFELSAGAALSTIKGGHQTNQRPPECVSPIARQLGAPHFVSLRDGSNTRLTWRFNAWAAGFPNPEIQPSVLPARIWFWNVVEHVAPALDQLRKKAKALNQNYSGDDLDEYFKKPPQKAAGIFALRPGFENRITLKCIQPRWAELRPRRTMRKSKWTVPK
jgi:hypothetical protein